MSEQIGQENSQKPVQTIKKSRSREEKVGRLKYNQQLLKRTLAEIQEVRAMQRVILNGLKGAGYFHFDVPMVEKIAFEDAADAAILEDVRQAGLKGVFPKDVAKDLSEYSLKYFNVSRRIVRMNKRFECETGERLFEKRGWKWALTTFAFEVWGKTQQDLVNKTFSKS